MRSWIECCWFGDFNANLDRCVSGCTEVKSCMIATCCIPAASISELGEYLVSSNYSIRSRAKTRLEKLRELMHL